MKAITIRTKTWVGDRTWIPLYSVVYSQAPGSAILLLLDTLGDTRRGLITGGHHNDLLFYFRQRMCNI